MIISIIDFIFVMIESFIIARFYHFFMGLKYKSRWLTILFYFLFFAIDLSVTYLDMSNSFQIIFNIVSFFILLLLFTSGNFTEKIALSIFLNALMMSISYLSIVFISKLYSTDFIDTICNKGIIRISILILSKLLLFIVLFFLLNVKKKIVPKLKTEEYLLITIVVIISVFIEYILRNYLLIKGNNYNVFFLSTLAMLLLNVVVYLFINLLSLKNIENEELITTKFKLEQQQEDYENIKKQYRETIETRHDIKNHILCALSLAEENKIDELKDFLNKYLNENVGNLKIYVNTKNDIFNAVINLKFSKAEKENIDVKCIVNNDIDFPNNVDMCTILSNLLDNAIEACEKNTNPSSITLDIDKIENEILIVIKNTVEENILQKNPNLYTSKSEKSRHGIGINSVKSVLKKYDGTLSYEIKNNIFITKVLFKNTF